MSTSIDSTTCTVEDQTTTRSDLLEGRLKPGDMYVMFYPVTKTEQLAGLTLNRFLDDMWYIVYFQCIKVLYNDSLY